jgi:hypothetical protein
MSLQYFHHIHSPSPFPYICSLFIGTNPQAGPDLCSCLLFLRKKSHFCLFKIYIESFIMTFSCKYVLYPELVHPLHFLLST